MTFKEECVENFTESIKTSKLEPYILDFVVEAFSAGFEYGSLNGASEDIKKSVVKNSKPINNEKARQIVEKMREILR